MVTTSRRRWGWKLGLASTLAVGGAISSLENTALAQITPDTTLGSENSTVTSTSSVDQIKGGATRSTNLFHSFQEFNVDRDRGAYFTNPAGIENILSRVTGNNPSNILGTLGVSGGNANLFLINPKGIIFGPNARLDVNGSFVGTTANGIGLANGDSFSTNPGEPLPTGLLNVNPNAFLFNQLAAQPTIQNQSRSGLEVNPGRSLLLLGGDVSLEGGILQAPGGRVNLGGVAEAGTVGLEVDGNNLSLSFLDDVEKADVSLTNGAIVDVTAGGSGSITINARNLEVLGESRLVAGNKGHELGAVGPGSQAGDITLNTTGVTKVGQSSSIENWVNRDVTGNGGNINIKAGSLLLTDSAALDTRNVGQGDSGNILVQAGGNVSLADAEIINDTYGQGDSGNILVQAGGNVSLTDTYIYSFTFGQGDSGNISVLADDNVSLADAEIINDTYGQGDSGNISVQADGDAFLTDLYISNTASGGDAGDILVEASGNISTESFIISAGTAPFAEGDAGNISVQADGNVSFVGGSIGTATYGQGDVGNISVQADGNVSADSLFILNDSFGDGDGANISVQADGSVFFVGGDIRASTSGKGDAGNISVQAGVNVSLANKQIEGVEIIFTDRPSSVYFTNSSISSNVKPGAEGEGGDIYIQARSLDVNYGFRLSAVTYGRGNAGNIQVEALDSVTLSGINPQYGFSSGLFTNTEEGASRQGGDITVRTSDLRLVDGAVLSARTRSEFNGGNITTNVNTLEVMGGGQMLTTAFSSGDAGSIAVNADDITISGRDPAYEDRSDEFDQGAFSPASPFSGLLSNTNPDSTGNGGDIEVNTGQHLTVENGAQVSVSGPSGQAGNLTATANSIVLDRGKLTAVTGAGEGGNITLGVPDLPLHLLLMQNNSEISAEALATANGGNINIDTNLLVALEKSNINANAVGGRGGEVRINTQGLFRSPDSQITATSELGPQFSGTVELNTPDVDPSRGLVALPVVPVNTEVAQTCTPGGSQQQSQFVVTGRGGLPPSPNEALSSDAVHVDWVTLNPGEEDSPSPVPVTNPTSPIQKPIIEAQGWVNNEKGEVVLTASAASAQPRSARPSPAECRASQSAPRD